MPLAVDRGADRGAGFVKPRWMKLTYLADEIGLRNHSKIVEARNAFRRHAVVDSESEFGWDVPDRPGDGCRNDAAENRDRSRAGHDEERSPADVFEFAPPDLPAVNTSAAHLREIWALRSLTSQQSRTFEALLHRLTGASDLRGVAILFKPKHQPDHVELCGEVSLVNISQGLRVVMA